MCYPHTAFPPDSAIFMVESGSKRHGEESWELQPGHWPPWKLMSPEALVLLQDIQRPNYN